MCENSKDCCFSCYLKEEAVVCKWRHAIFPFNLRPSIRLSIRPLSVLNNLCSLFFLVIESFKAVCLVPNRRLTIRPTTSLAFDSFKVLNNVFFLLHQNKSPQKRSSSSSTKYSFLSLLFRRFVIENNSLKFLNWNSLSSS